MTGIEDTTTRRTFDGEMSSEFELWLGEAFNSWLPSRRAVEVRTEDGMWSVFEGDTIALFGKYATVAPAKQRRRS